MFLCISSLYPFCWEKWRFRPLAKRIACCLQNYFFVLFDLFFVYNFSQSFLHCNSRAHFFVFSQSNSKLSRKIVVTSDEITAPLQEFSNNESEGGDLYENEENGTDNNCSSHFTQMKKKLKKMAFTIILHRTPIQMKKR